MDWQDRIEKIPNVLSGKPVIKDTRIAVELIMDFLNSGASEDEIIANYSQLSREDIEACRQCTASGEPLSPMTWAEWEAAVFGAGDGKQKAC